MGLRLLIDAAFAIQAGQLVDSRLATTREHWRRMLGWPEAVVKDPRPLVDAAAAHLAAKARGEAP